MKKLSDQSLMCRYVYSRLGYATEDGTRQHELVCRALAKDGRPKPDGVTDKAWAKAHWEYLHSLSIKSLAEQRKEEGWIPRSKRKAARIAARQLDRQIARIEARPDKPKRLPKGTKPAAPRFRIDPNHPDFLSSFEWRQLRMRVLTHYGLRCMCCGATPDHGAVMHVDHIKPRKKRPDLALTFDNLQVLCHECSHGKGNWDETDWRPKEPVEYDVDPDVKELIRSIATEIRP